MKTRYFLREQANGFENEIKAAAEIIKNGGLVAVPTETVYGLAANALMPDAVKRIFEVKGRPQDNPLIVHVAKPEHVYLFAKEISPLAKKAIKAFMPGPFTAVLPKQSVIPSVTTAGLDSVAIRCPSHEIMNKIISASGVPIAAPSANISGLPSPTCFEHCLKDLNGKIEGIVDGGSSEFGVESTVVSFLSDKAVICRPGAITKEMLVNLLGEENVIDLSEDKSERPVSPGMKYRHYSPSIPLYTVTGEKAEEYIKQRCENENGIAVMSYKEDRKKYNTLHFFEFGERGKPETQAASLFAALRAADDKKDEISLILSVAPENKKEGAAVLNRLNKAASQKKIHLVKNPTVIGVTGKSGSGKSTVSKEIANRLGYFYIDCDLLANDIIWNFPPLTERIKKEFAVSSRKELSEKVFSSPDLLERLNFLTLPVIISEIHKVIHHNASLGVKGFIIDGATIIESKVSVFLSALVFVKCDEETAINRIIKRDNISREIAVRRIKSQKPDEFYKKEADITLATDCELELSVKNLINELQLKGIE